MGSCRVYPSIAQFFNAYDRSKPLACDAFSVPSTLVKCHWDVAQHCLVADTTVRVAFKVNLLWQTPTEGYWLGNLIMLNQLGTVNGAPGGEIAGTDLIVKQSTPAAHVSSPECSRIIDLAASDRVWAVPCCIQGISATLTNALSGSGANTVNAVEVMEIS